MRLADFLVSAPQAGTTPIVNFQERLWLPVAAGAATDAMATASPEGIVAFNEAGLYLVTFNVTAEVTLPSDAGDQYAEVVAGLGTVEGVVG